MLDDPLHAANVAIHIGAGALALTIGLAPMLSAKGGATHRATGRWFAGIGAVVIATAIIGDILYDPPAPLVAATLAAAYQYAGGLRALALRDRGPGWVDALLALAGAVACWVLLATMGRGTASWTPAIGYSVIGYLAPLIAYDLSRHFWPQTWLRKARPLDHGLKLTGAYFAMLSAGAGNVLRDAQPWSQLGPSLLGLVVMLALLTVHLRPPRHS